MFSGIQNGHTYTSLSDITEATGITRGSLYNAWNMLELNMLDSKPQFALA